MHKGNKEIPLQTGRHHTSTQVIHITPGLWQCTTVWSTKEIIKRLQTVQNMCPKLVLQCSKYSNTTLALMDLHRLPPEQYIQYKTLIIMYKGINNIAPKYIMDLTEISKLRRDNMWSNNVGIRLNVAAVKYKNFSSRLFSYVAPTLRNALPKIIGESKKNRQT